MLGEDARVVQLQGKIYQVLMLTASNPTVCEHTFEELKGKPVGSDFTKQVASSISSIIKSWIRES